MKNLFRFILFIAFTISTSSLIAQDGVDPPPPPPPPPTTSGYDKAPTAPAYQEIGKKEKGTPNNNIPVYDKLPQKDPNNKVMESSAKIKPPSTSQYGKVPVAKAAPAPPGYDKAEAIKPGPPPGYDKTSAIKAAPAPPGYGKASAIKTAPPPPRYDKASDVKPQYENLPKKDSNKKVMESSSKVKPPAVDPKKAKPIQRNTSMDDREKKANTKTPSPKSVQKPTTTFDKNKDAQKKVSPKKPNPKSPKGRKGKGRGGR